MHQHYGAQWDLCTVRKVLVHRLRGFRSTLLLLRPPFKRNPPKITTNN
jgi:hypothetical protein